MADPVGIRAKVEGGGKVAWLGIVLDPASKRVTEILAVVGSKPEFLERPVEEPWSQFEAWVQEMQFYTKYDAAETSDLDRWAQQSFANLEYLDQLLADLKKGTASNLEYKLQNDLQRILGERTPRVGLKIERLSADARPKKEESGEKPTEAKVDPTLYVPLALVMSPLRGTFLSALAPGDEVVIKLKDRSEAKTRAFLEKLDEAEREATEFTAVLKERRPNPAGGVFVFLALPDGSEGLVVEEEPGIKVKRPGSVPTPAAAAGSFGAAPSGGGLFEDPKLLIALAGAVTALVAAVVIVFFL